MSLSSSTEVAPAAGAALSLLTEDVDVGTNGTRNKPSDSPRRSGRDSPRCSGRSLRQRPHAQTEGECSTSLQVSAAIFRHFVRGCVIATQRAVNNGVAFSMPTRADMVGLPGHLSTMLAPAESDHYQSPALYIES